MHRLLIAATFLACAASAQALDLDRIKATTEYLSSDQLKGRAAGTPESHLAGAFIAEQFADSGLSEPEGGYLQGFALQDGERFDHNVIGHVPAAIPTPRSVLVLAHFDGLGIDENATGEDQIRNAALDNAVGVAALIELATRFSRYADLNANVVFIATGAEEIGMLGVKHYIANPLYPIAEVQAVINLDGFNVSGERADYFVMPKHPSQLLELISAVAAEQGWQYQEQGWEDQMDDKFDTAPFLQLGIDAATIWTGSTLPNGEPAPQPKFGAIHSVDDEINEYWDWSGVAAHLDLYEGVIAALATAANQ